MSRAAKGLLLAGLLLAGLLLGTAQAVGVKLRPQGAQMTQLVQSALAAISTPGLPLTLDTSGGPILVLGGLVLGGTATSSAPFNPDLSARTLVSGSGPSAERRIEFNPQGPQPLNEAVAGELAKELGLVEWTSAAARIRFSGADLNGDGKIDLADLAILMNNLGKTGALPGDLNQDQKVDDADLRIFSAQYKP